MKWFASSLFRSTAIFSVILTVKAAGFRGGDIILICEAAFFWTMANMVERCEENDYLTRFKRTVDRD